MRKLFPCHDVAVGTTATTLNVFTIIIFVHYCCCCVIGTSTGDYRHYSTGRIRRAADAGENKLSSLPSPITVGVSGTDQQPVLCPLDYHSYSRHSVATTFSGNNRGSSFLGAAGEDTDQLLLHPPPIEIVRQAGTFVEFKILSNSPFFSSSTTNPTGMDNNNGHPSNNSASFQQAQRTRTRIRTVFNSGAMSTYNHCQELSSNDDEGRFLTDDDDASPNNETTILKAYCSPRGKNSLVSLYVHFDSDDAHDENSITSSRTMCDRCSDDDTTQTASGTTANDSLTLVTEFVFNLICLPTCSEPIVELLSNDDEEDRSSEPSGKEKLLFRKEDRSGTIFFKNNLADAAVWTAKETTSGVGLISKKSGVRPKGCLVPRRFLQNCWIGRV